MKNEVLSTTLVSKLDGLAVDIHNLFAIIRGGEQAIRYPSPTEDEATSLEDEETSLANLKNCASSAERLISTAAEMVNSRSECSSQVPRFLEMNREKVQRVEEWQQDVHNSASDSALTSPATTFSETTLQSYFSELTTSTDATTLSEAEIWERQVVTDMRNSRVSNSREFEDITTEKFTVDCNLRVDMARLDVLEHLGARLARADVSDDWGREGLSKYRQKDYAGAEQCLESALEQIDSEEVVCYRTDLLWALASCCAHLGKFERVEEILDGEEASDQWKYAVVEIVLSRYLKDGMWTQANELLVKYRKEFDDRDDSLIRLLMDCRRNGAWIVASCIAMEYSNFQGKCQALEECVSTCRDELKWDEAAGFLLEILKEKEFAGDEIELAHTMHQLGEIFLYKREYSRAKQYMSSALDIRTRKLGKKHSLVRDSAYLLAKIIYKNNGITGAYNNYKTLLPPKYQGLSLESLTLMLECLELEILAEMYPSQAAQQVGIRLLKNIAPETSSLNLEAIRSGIKSGGVVGLKTRPNDALLHVFAESGNEIAVRFILKMGARPDTLSSSNNTPLYLAIENNHEAVVETLLECVANIGSPEFRLAVEKNREPLVRLLLERGATIETTDSDENSLFIAAISGEISLVKLLLKYRRGSKWLAPLMLYNTAINGHAEVLQLLLENGAVDSRTPSQDVTPYFRHPQRHLRSDTALHECVRQGFDGNIMKMLVNSDNINTIDRNGETALHIAASRRIIDIVEILLDRLANINISNLAGRTALHCVVCHSDSAAAEITKALLNQRANVDEKDNHGDTPLHIAIFEAKPLSHEIIQTLLEAGADPKATKRLSESALSIAVKLGIPLSSEITGLLIDHGADSVN